MKDNTRQMLFFVAFAIVLLLLFSGIILSTASGKALIGSQSVLPDSSRIIELRQYVGDSFVLTEDTIRADVLVLDGTLTISGTIYGDVYVFSGNVSLRRTARIYGHIVISDGELFELDGNAIAGDVLELFDGRTRYTERRDMEGICKPIARFKEGLDVVHDQPLDGNSLVELGDVSVQGLVNGDLVVMDGDVFLGATSVVLGHVIALNGDVFTSSGGRITGQKVSLLLSEVIVPLEEPAEPDLPEADLDIDAEIEDFYFKSRKEGDIFRFMGDVHIKANEAIDGDIMVTRGDAQIAGEVNGDIVVIAGDIFLTPGAFVDGDVVSIGGKIHRDPGGTVTGDLVETSGHRLVKHIDSADNAEDIDTDFEFDSNEWHESNPGDYGKSDGLFRYNRVEALFLGFKYDFPGDYWASPDHSRFTFQGHLGYGFNSNQWRFSADIGRRLFTNIPFYIGGRVYDLTETADEWLLTNYENSAAAFFLNEDFLDYYRRTGYAGYIKQRLAPHFEISAAYQVDKFRNMKKVTNWSLFYKNRRFQGNPLIDEVDNLKSASLNLLLDTRDDRDRTMQGWFIDGSAILAGADFDNDGILLESTGKQVDFERYLLDVRYFQPLGMDETIALRFRAGTSRGYLPLQYQFDMGGLGSMRGHPYKYFQNGNRMLLGNIEYRVLGNRDRFGNIFIDDLGLVLFCDYGLVWNTASPASFRDGFDGIDCSDFHTDLGVSLMTGDGSFRVNFAKRVDVGDQPWEITCRFLQVF